MAHPESTAAAEAKIRARHTRRVPQLEREHADEVHAPNAESHGERAAVRPKNAATASCGANALRDLDRDVGAEGGDPDRQKDERGAVGVLDHTPPNNGCMEEAKVARYKPGNLFIPGRVSDWARWG